jgi:tripartite-type tricarboxylate transporter receptor subunit TctC
MFNKVRVTRECKKFMNDGAFNHTFLTGKAFSDWVAKEEKRHHELVESAGWLAKK